MIRNRKAVETAALWKPWRTVTSRSRPMHRFFHRSHSAWKTARGARSFSHSYAPLLLLDIPTRKKIPDRPASRSKNRPNRSTNALLTGSQQTRPDQQAVQPPHGGLHKD